MINEEDLNRAYEETLNSINLTLFPLIFDLSLYDYRKKKYTRNDELVKVAEVLIKFSSLMVQIYWLKITSMKKSDKIEYHVSQELEHILNQIWAGHLKHTSGYSNSILQHAAALPETSILGRSILNPNIFIKWRRLISLKDDYHKKFQHELIEGTVANDFIVLLKALPILRRIRYQNGKIFLMDFDNCEIDPFPFLRFFNNYTNPLYLYEINQKDHEVILIYEEPYDAETFELHISQIENPSENDKFLWIRRIKGFDDVKNIPVSIVYLFEGGYKHIVNISKAIISKTGGKKSIKEYLLNYADASQEIKLYENPLDFLTLVIAERGPINVLRQIIGENKEFMEEYLDYFESMGLKPKQYWLEQRQKYIDNKKNRYKDLIGMDENMLKGSISDQIKLDASIWCILNAAGTCIKLNEGIIDPISRRLQILHTFSKDKTLNNNNLIETNKIFERTYKFLIIFYTAVCKIFYKIKDQVDCSDNIDTDNLLHDISEELEEKYKDIRRLSAGLLMKTFREEFINRTEKTLEYQAMKHFFGQNIYDLINEKNLDKYIKINGIATNWIKHDKLIDMPMKEKRNEFYNDTIDLFTFLQYGTFDIPEYEEYTLTPIYPMIISFKEARRNREGMNICHYEILSFDMDPQKTQNSQNSIKILTEQRYYQNENYYCIPNKNKSSMSWWIDPFLIQCSKFDNMLDQFRKTYDKE